MPTIHSLALRALASGALAVGLLSTAPIADSHAATRNDRVTHHHHKHASLAPSARRVGSAMSIAVHQKGDPYSYGASGPNAFDCSGLTFYSFRKAGFKHIPRTSSAQAHFAQHIKRSNMKRGDLIFFYDGGGVYHVGVYAGFTHGHRWVLHAPHSGTRVRTDKLWTDKWFPGTLRYRR
ncbi:MULTISPECIES: C40 family peptidase [unclassified Nocardioides]|jgi:cell wall-associated NlpC family hydrolase|uniref:C40 family peptidase n=1 Tax=Nocardioides sp. URHA0032 TaxID=1380388 RepID=UPI000490551D|nr:C40 family peptidase [Nocardioides sp. URHA0032]